MHSMPLYGIKTQIDIILACFALNNYIMQQHLKGNQCEDEDTSRNAEEEEGDQSFYDDEVDLDVDLGNEDKEHEDNLEYGLETRAIRDHIAQMSWEARCR